ncbi:MAG TPA: tautomerase family protein [Xanthobacteraceae bacterium]
MTGHLSLARQPSSCCDTDRSPGHVARSIRMPEVYVHAVKGRTAEQKRALINDITQSVVKNFNVPIEAVLVEIVESEPANKAKGGVLFSERR